MFFSSSLAVIAVSNPTDISASIAYVYFIMFCLSYKSKSGMIVHNISYLH